MTSDAPPGPTARQARRLAELAATDRRGQRWAVARWWLLGLVVVTNLLAFLASPVRSDDAGFLADLTSGRVTWVQPSAFELDDPPGPDWSPFGNADASPAQTSVRWGTRGGPTFEADLSTLAALDPEDTSLPRRVDVLRTARATARAAGHAPPAITYAPRERWSHWADGIAFLAFLVMLFSLTAGPQPRRFTKWGTFWIMCLPVGLGVVRLLLIEAPWSARMAALEPPWPGRTGPRPNGEVRRRGGWWGLLVLVVVGGLLGPFVRGAHTWLLDHHPAGGDTWQLVDVRGHATTVPGNGPR